ncbi:MAG: G8 domain-containing protein, partial [Pseudomonadota bacterium]
MAGSNSHASHSNPQLDLLPVNAAGVAVDATHVAVRSGSWFDPATWGGEIPGQGAVVQIPEGIEVEYAGRSDAKLFMVRVDGDLTFTADNGIETKMVVDTMITSPGSTLNVLASRASDGTVDIVFAESSPSEGGFSDLSAGDGVIGRHRWDPEQLSLGLVASGEVEIRGQETKAHLKLAEGPLAGESTLTFDAWASGSSTWKPGDTLVVGASNYVGHGPGGAFNSQDEIRTIASIEFVGDQMVVHLDRPLDFFHNGPRDPVTGEELTTSVGNLSRNVTLSSAVADQNGDGL